MKATKAQIAKERKKLYDSMLADPQNPLRADNNELNVNPARIRLPRAVVDAITAHGSGEWFDCPVCANGRRRDYGNCVICNNRRVLVVCGKCDGSGWNKSEHVPCKECGGIGCLSVSAPTEAA